MGVPAIVELSEQVTLGMEGDKRVPICEKCSRDKGFGSARLWISKNNEETHTRMTPRDLPKSWDLSADMVVGSLACSVGIQYLTAVALVSTFLLAVRGV